VALPLSRAGPGPEAGPSVGVATAPACAAATPGAPPPAARKLIFELLVAVLQLLDGAGHLANLRFEALDPQHLFGGRTVGFVLAGGLLRGFCPNMRPIADSGEFPSWAEAVFATQRGGNQGRCRKPTEHRRSS
jgi:hypothetical protein